ncbi:MAG: hypothetical protein Q9191_007818 [Dirinaria sp. TL-2023a]
MPGRIDIFANNFVRPYEYKDKPPGKDAENLISADELTHQRFRKVLAPAFAGRPEHEAVIKGYVDLLIRKLDSTIEHSGPEATSLVDVLKWFNYTTFDIIGDILWGSSFGCLDEVRYHPWIQVIAQFKTALIVGATKFYHPLDTILMLATPKSAMADLMQIWTTTERKITQRLKSGSERQDMISYMAESHGSSPMLHGSNDKMSLPEVEINAMLIVVAGSESVTTVLTGVTNYLLQDQIRLDSLVREIRSTFRNEEDINRAAVGRLPYLNAALSEGLRLCPTIPDGMRRQVPKGGAVVAGHFLPEDTVVSIPRWSTYQSAGNFARPQTFAPERWLENDVDAVYRNDRKEALQPFSLGAHNCPGRGIAYLEMRLILARLLWNFDLERVPGMDPPRWGKQNIYWFWEKRATYARIRRAQR